MLPHRTRVGPFTPLYNGRPFIHRDIRVSRQGFYLNLLGVVPPEMGEQAGRAEVGDGDLLPAQVAVGFGTPSLVGFDVLLGEVRPGGASLGHRGTCGRLHLKQVANLILLNVTLIKNATFPVYLLKGDLFWSLVLYKTPIKFGYFVSADLQEIKRF